MGAFIAGLFSIHLYVHMNFGMIVQYLFMSIRFRDVLLVFNVKIKHRKSMYYVHVSLWYEIGFDCWQNAKVESRVLFSIVFSIHAENNRSRRAKRNFSTCQKQYWFSRRPLTVPYLCIERWYTLYYSRCRFLGARRRLRPGAVYRTVVKFYLVCTSTFNVNIAPRACSIFTSISRNYQ